VELPSEETTKAIDHGVGKHWFLSDGSSPRYGEDFAPASVKLPLKDEARLRNTSGNSESGPSATEITTRYLQMQVQSPHCHLHTAQVANGQRKRSSGPPNDPEPSSENTSFWERTKNRVTFQHHDHAMSRALPADYPHVKKSAHKKGLFRNPKAKPPKELRRVEANAIYAAVFKEIRLSRV